MQDARRVDLRPRPHRGAATVCLERMEQSPSRLMPSARALAEEFTEDVRRPCAFEARPRQAGE